MDSPLPCSITLISMYVLIRICGAAAATGGRSQGERGAADSRVVSTIEKNAGVKKAQPPRTIGGQLVEWILTFATHLAAGTRSECQIQNSTRNLHLLVVLDSNIRKDAR
jgi:hypothetical protein